MTFNDFLEVEFSMESENKKYYLVVIWKIPLKTFKSRNSLRLCTMFFFKLI